MPENFRRVGALRHRLHFQQRGAGNDGMGGSIPGAGAVVTKFTVSAALRPRTGSEVVTAARMDGRQPYVVTVRFASHLLDVTPAWQIEDARDPGRVLNIKSPLADPDGRRQWLEFIAEEGAPS